MRLNLIATPTIGTHTHSINPTTLTPAPGQVIPNGITPAVGTVVVTASGTSPAVLDEQTDDEIETLPEEDMPSTAERQRWVLCIEGSPTGDGRLFEDGAFSWRELPLPFMALDRTTHMHQEARLVANIVEIERVGSEIIGYTEMIESDDPEVLNLQRLIRNGDLRGVSVDMDNLEGKMIFPEMDPEESMNEMNLAGPELRFSAARIMGATALPFPAFAEAKQDSDEDALVAALLAGAGSFMFLSEIDDDAATVRSAIGDDEEAQAAFDRILDTARGASPDEPDDDEAGKKGKPKATSSEPYVDADGQLSIEHTLVASISPPDLPPLSWFGRPASSSPRTITEEGQISGYLAYHETCHIGLPGCVKPPKSATNYAAFLTGELRTAEGEIVKVGQITVSAGHADRRETDPRKVKEHYDHTGFCAADVVIGEDDIGIWYAGALRHGMDDGQLREFMAADVSGDWRRIKGSMELVSIASVNVPGFPKIEALIAGGEPVSIIASAECPPQNDDGLDPTRELIAASIGRHPLQLDAQREELARSIGRHPDQIRAALARRRFGIGS